MSFPTRSCAAFPLWFPGLAGVIALAVDATAQTVKLSGPLARPTAGDIRSFQVNADGSRVVYLADQEQDDVFELFSLEPGTLPIRLNAPLPAGSDVDSFHLSPDGRRVVYLAPLDGPFLFELFSVLVDGGPTVRLNAPLVERVSSLFQIDPTSRHVVFRARATSTAPFELFSAPIDGSRPAVRLSRTESVQLLQVGGGRVVFHGRRPGMGNALFSVPLDGQSEPVQLIPFQADNDLPFEITADGRRVLYGEHGLSSVAIDARGTPVVLSVGRVSSWGGSPDGRRAVYVRAHAQGEMFSVSILGDEAPLRIADRAGQFDFDAEGAHVLYTDLDRHLFSVPILGGAAPARISGPGEVTQMRPTRGKRVVFVEDVDGASGSQLELESAPVDGQGPTVLLATTSTQFTQLEFLVAREHVVYRSPSQSKSSAALLELFSVPLDGSRPPLRINQALVAEREVQPNFALSGDGNFVAYLSDQDANDLFELFLAPASASRAAVKLNPPLASGQVEGDVSAARLTPDGTRAVFLADDREDEVYELFTVGSAGGETPLRLNEPLVPGGDVLRFELAPERVVYLADQDVNDRLELFSVPTAGGLSVRLSGAAELPNQFLRLTPDGSRVVFNADDDGDPLYELYSVPVDGSAPPTRLPPEFEPIALGSFAISPLSDRVVYAADPDRDGAPELFTVPITGGSEVRLSEPGVPGVFRIFSEFRFTPDGLRVLYRRISSGEQALFSALVDGGSAPVELSSALPDVVHFAQTFALSPDGTRVVFSADSVVAQEFELFSMPADGSSGPLRLNAEAAAWLEVSPDGSRVVFLVRTTVSSNQYELHSVPLDASAPPVVLAPALRYELLHASQSGFRISPDGAHVVFRAAAGVDPFRLFGVPIDGSRPRFRLSQPSTDAIVRDDYRFTPDGRTVLYRIGEGPTDFGSELFRVAIRGSDAPVRIDRQSDDGTTVYEFDLSLDGRRVLHRTARYTDLVVELFASPLMRAPHATRSR